MWWWVALALAGPTRTEAPTQRITVPYPAGVTSTIVPRELVKGDRPKSVTFTVEGPPAARDGLLVIRGVLANTGTAPATVFLVSAPHTGGPFVLSPRGITFQPPPPSPDHPPIPETPPMPEELVLPAGARVVFESALRLDRWAWPAHGEVDLDWTFAFWVDPVQGSLPGRLARKP